MLLVSYIQQYFNTSITVLTNQVWKLLIALFKVPNTGAFTVHRFEIPAVFTSVQFKTISSDANWVPVNLLCFSIFCTFEHVVLLCMQHFIKYQVLRPLHATYLWLQGLLPRRSITLGVSCSHLTQISASFLPTWTRFYRHGLLDIEELELSSSLTYAVHGCLDLCGI